MIGYINNNSYYAFFIFVLSLVISDWLNSFTTTLGGLEHISNINREISVPIIPIKVLKNSCEIL